MNIFAILPSRLVRLPSRWRRLGILLAVLIGWVADQSALGQGTTISYQGQLSRAGAPAEGKFDLQFSLYPSLADGAAIGPKVTLPDVSVSGGRFTVDLDFGAGAFTGSARWLEIQVRTAGSGAFAKLAPRQALNAVPYALYALTPAGPAGAPGAKGDKGEKGEKGDPGPARLSNADLFLRSDNDTYNGLGWFGSSKLFGTEAPEGPVLYGLGGGGLGSYNGGAAQLALRWTPSGTVGIGLGTRPANAPLHVASQGGAGDQFILGNPQLVNGDTTLVMGLTSAKNGGSYLQAIAETGVSYGDLLVNPDGGRVGIRTRTPTAELEVNGTVKAQKFVGDGSGLVNVPGTAHTILSVTAFGSNDHDQINVPRDLGDVIAISANYFYSVALKNDGTIVGWGNNQSGQLSIPQELNNNMAAISAGRTHLVALRKDGEVVVFGGDKIGTLFPPGDLNNVAAISAGGFHTLALKKDGTVAAWGGNDEHQCDVPTIAGEVIAVSAGRAHSVVLKKNGTVVAWGYNSYGQCNVPNDLTGVIAITCGDYHSVALKGDGTVVVWGGMDAAHQKDVPQGLGGVVAVSAQGFLTVALKNDGTVVAWGGEYANPEIQVPPNLDGVKTIAAGGNHVLTLRKTQVFAGQLNVTGPLTATAFKTTSDRNAKENFSPIDPETVLNKVAALPITQWNFRGESGEWHVGPMAQDFHSTFGLGSDDRHIATVDADGVALAAIQGLNHKVQQLDGRNRELERLNQDLLQSLRRVEQRLVELESSRATTKTAPNPRVNLPTPAKNSHE